MYICVINLLGKTMNVQRIIFIAFIAAFLSSCHTEDIPVPEKNSDNTEQTEDSEDDPEDDPEQDPEDKPVNEELLLGLDATLNNMVESRRGVINAWQSGNEIGLYTENKNLKYTYDGSKWIAAEQYEVQNEQTVYAYHPYDQNATDMKLDIDLTKQEDVMYGKCAVTPDFPTAKPVMNHALSLIRIKLMRDEYIGKGLITDVMIKNVSSSLIMNILDGDIWIQEGKSDIPIGGGYMLNDDNPAVSEAILPPLYHPDGVSLSFKLDGKEMSYTFPSWHEWEAGNIYTYTIKIKGAYNGEVNKDDVPIDVEYWSQFGKTDEIVLRSVDYTDFENMFFIRTNHTKFGYDCYQNEGKPFGLYYTHAGSEPFEGKVRFVFMRGSQIVEKFQPIDIKIQGNWDGKKIQCYVTSAPGTYQLVPLFQRKGESTWFKALGYEQNGSDQEWMYEVKAPAPDNLPALRDIFLEKEGDNTNFLGYDIPYNEFFNVVYTISNKGKGALKGEIKAVWEREFKLKSNSYRPSTRKQNTTNDVEWADEIGRVSVSIQPGIRYWKGIMECKVSKYYAKPTDSYGNAYAVPVIHLYWKPEGSSEWTLLRLDADYLFNNDYQGADVWDETLNYINVSLEDWYD
jgi:hypothetical protein